MPWDIVFTRMNRHLVFALLILAASWLAGCSGDEDEGLTFPGGGNNDDTNYWTVMVYMAADNNLAVAGIGDIDEMEAAGPHKNVTTVVQAEFSPDNLAQYSCDASCFNRPNFNTFRYVVAGEGQAVDGPNGSATDIGNRDMTDPAQLKEFVQWAKQTYPADHYLLVLWNHGGGYTGLLEDDTSAPGHFMPMSDLRIALTGVGQLDVVDFDMCLMGAYETLVSVDGLCDYVVFSEEVVPGAGNEYQSMIDAIQANPKADPAAVAGTVAERFHASYQGHRSSTTISAYAMSGLQDLDTAVSDLANALRDTLTGLRTPINDAAAASQKYEYSQLKDLGDWLDRLRPNLPDPAHQALVDQVKSRMSAPSFRISNYKQNGSSAEAPDVSGSQGLTILLPSTADNMPDQGAGSFAAYQQLYSNQAWTTFLVDWLDGSGHVEDDYVDLGNERWEIYLVWEQQALSAGADLDIWVLEPSGDLFIPYLGTVTPNGNLTDDSEVTNAPYEGYVTNTHVHAGTYRFIACLYTDPGNVQPYYDVAYRNDPNGDFQSLYGGEPEFPRLSTATSFRDDDTVTWNEILDGAYTDLEQAAYLEIGNKAGRTMKPGEVFDRPEAPRPTAAQMAVVAQWLRRGRVKEQAPASSVLRSRVPRLLYHSVDLGGNR